MNFLKYLKYIPVVIQIVQLVESLTDKDTPGEQKKSAALDLIGAALEILGIKEVSLEEVSQLIDAFVAIFHNFGIGEFARKPNASTASSTGGQFSGSVVKTTGLP